MQDSNSNTQFVVFDSLDKMNILILTFTNTFIGQARNIQASAYILLYVCLTPMMVEKVILAIGFMGVWMLKNKCTESAPGLSREACKCFHQIDQNIRYTHNSTVMLQITAEHNKTFLSLRKQCCLQ